MKPNGIAIREVNLDNASRREISEFLNKEWGGFFKEYGIGRKFKSYVFQAREKENLVGIAIMRIRDGVAKLEDILIKKEYRKSGVGSALLSIVENKARKEGCNKIVIETSELHKDAISFYKERKYKVIAMLPKLYYNVDWYVFEKDLEK